jgi:hypothetical protein
MAERASVFNGVQFGVETTPGTSVAASKKLASLDILPTPSIAVDFYRPMGDKFPTVGVAGQDFTTARVTGKPMYSEFVYMLSGLLGAATITGPNADGAYTWTFAPASTGPDAFKTFTVERGSSVGAEKFTHGLFTQLGLTFDRSRADLSGAMIGQALSTGITLTASPTAIAQIPMSPKEFSVFADTTSGGLGTTKLTRLVRGNFQFGQGKYLPLWVVDAAQSSFVSVVESTPNAVFSLLVEADTQGVGFIANVRAGDTRFVRLQAVGPLIAGSSNYKMTIDMAVKFGQPSEFRDESGIYAVEYPATLTDDLTWGKALTAVVINTTATL